MQSNLLNCENALKAYIDYWKKEEKALYAANLGKNLSQNELTHLYEKGAAFREEEHRLFDAMQKAEELVKEAESSVQEARVALRFSRVEKEKITLNKQEWLRESAEANEREADKELEDFQRRKNQNIINFSENEY